MSIMKQLLAVAVLFPAMAIAAETVTQPVKQYRYDGESNYLYVVGPNGWGSADCPNATYVVIKPTLAGHKQLFAAIAAAHASAKTVKFFGSCADPAYFEATYVVVE